MELDNVDEDGELKRWMRNEVIHLNNHMVVARYFNATTSSYSHLWFSFLFGFARVSYMVASFAYLFNLNQQWRNVNDFDATVCVQR